MSGHPLDVRAEVTSLRTDALQALFGKGEPAEQLGRSAAIRIGGVDVVMNSARQQVFSRHVFTEHGIDPLQRHLLVVKSTQHFMNDFGKLAAHVVRCDGPGTMTSDLASLPYERAPRPLLGLDPAELLELQPMASVSGASRRALRRANQT
jgi:microcystin degradation protein MlrC